MSDIYYTDEIRTERDPRGDIRDVSGDEQLAQQMIAVAGNAVSEVFQSNVATPEDIEEFAGTVRTRLQSIDRIGTVQSVDVRPATPDNDTISITMETTLASATNSFDI